MIARGPFHWLLPEGAPSPEITSDDGGRWMSSAPRLIPSWDGDHSIRLERAGDVGDLRDSRHGSANDSLSILGDKLAHRIMTVFTGVSTGAYQRIICRSLT